MAVAAAQDQDQNQDQDNSNAAAGNRRRENTGDPDDPLVAAFMAMEEGTATRNQRRRVRMFLGRAPRGSMIDGKRMKCLLAFPSEMMKAWEDVWEREQREQHEQHEQSEVVDVGEVYSGAPPAGDAGTSDDTQQKEQEPNVQTTSDDKLESTESATATDILTRVRKLMNRVLQGQFQYDELGSDVHVCARSIDSDLRELLTRARAEIDTVPFRDVKSATLTQYTDACFLLALWQLFRPMAPASVLGPGRKRRRSSASDVHARRCRACREVLPEVQIKVKTRVQGLCVSCSAEAIRFAKEAGDGDGGEPLADMWALAERWVLEHRSASSTPPAPPAPASTPPAPVRPIDPSALIEIPDEPQREKTIPRAYTASPHTDADPWISDAGDGARFIDGVKMLDLALIVAGGGDEGRRELIRKLDTELQRHIREAREGERDFDEFDWPRKSRSRATTPAAEAAAEAGEASTGVGDLTCARQPIPSIDPPSLQAYSSRDAGAPFVLRRYAANGEHHPRWQALDRWQRAGYLLRRTGRGRVVPVELGGSYTEAGWGQAIVSWQQFLAQAGWEGPMVPEEDVENDEAIAQAMAADGDDEEGEMCEALDNFAPAASSRAGVQFSRRTSEEMEKEKSEEKEREKEREKRDDAVPVYLAQHGLFRQFPALEADFSVPDYVFSSPEAQLVPPGVAYAPPSEPLVNVWIGSPGVLSPAHTDPYFNCYVQVLGRKRVWLAPPSVTEHMHAFGGKEKDGEGMDVDPEWVVIQKIRKRADAEDQDKDADEVEDKVEGESEGRKVGDEEGDEEWDDEEDESLFASLMTNTSRLPLLKPGQNVDSIAAKYPDFENVLPHAMETVLEPGDMLVIPPGWWHAMRQEGDGPGWSISFWY